MGAYFIRFYMKKEIDKIYDKFIDIYKIALKNFDKITLNIIDFYFFRYKYIELEIKTHLEKKPPKIFKKRLKKWKEKKMQLEKEKHNLLISLKKEINELKK